MSDYPEHLTRTIDDGVEDVTLTAQTSEEQPLRIYVRGYRLVATYAEAVALLPMLSEQVAWLAERLGPVDAEIVEDDDPGDVAPLGVAIMLPSGRAIDVGDRVRYTGGTAAFRGATGSYVGATLDRGAVYVDRGTRWPAWWPVGDIAPEDDGDIAPEDDGDGS